MISEERLPTKRPAQRAGSTACVAFDLGAESVRVVEVEWRADGSESTILRRGSAPLPTGFWRDVAGSIEAGTSAIRQAISAAGITAHSVAVALPRRLVTLRFARLPHAPPEQLQTLMAFEAQNYVLFPMEDVVFDFYAPDGDMPAVLGGDEMQTVILAAARKDIVAGVMAIFDRAGLEVSRLSVSAAALAELVAGSIEPTALIDIEPGEMDVAVVGEGRLLFTRASTLETIDPNAEGADRRFAEEIARSFTAYQNENRQQQIRKVFLVGESVSGTLGDEIARTLRPILELEVTRLQGRLVPAGDPTVLAYATAIGLARQSLLGAVCPLNLVPAERTERKARLAQRRRQVALGVIGLFLLVGLAYGAINVYTSGIREQAETVAANRRLKDVTAKYDIAKKQHDRLDKLATEMSAAMDRAHPSVDVLYALNDALPPSAYIWLTQFAFERGRTITLHGESRSPSAATDLVIALQGSGAFRDVRLGYLGDAQESTSGKISAVSGGPAAAAPAPIAGAAVKPGARGARKGSAFARAAAPETLTSFVITCRVNPTAQSLVSPRRVRTGGQTVARPIRSKAQVSPIGGEIDTTDMTDENGGDN